MLKDVVTKKFDRSFIDNHLQDFMSNLGYGQPGSAAVALDIYVFGVIGRIGPGIGNVQLSAEHDHGRFGQIVVVIVIGKGSAQIGKAAAAVFTDIQVGAVLVGMMAFPLGHVYGRV